MSIQNSHKTHDLFFGFLTIKKLNELLHRADIKTHYLENQINNEFMKNGLQNVYAKVELTKNKLDEYSIYVNFFNTPTNQQFGHLSFHLMPTIKNRTRYGLGRLHARNNKNTQRNHTLRINQSGNTIFMKLVPYPVVIRDEIQTPINITLSILNQYFDINSDYYLSNKLTNHSNKVHPFQSQIISQMNKSKTPIKNTRKVKHT